MKTLLGMLLFTTVIVLIPPDVPAGWGTGCAPAVAGSAFAMHVPMHVQARLKTHWVWKKTAREHERALFKDGLHVGSYDLDGKWYMPRYGPGKWGTVSACPVQAPKRHKIEVVKSACGDPGCDCGCGDGGPCTCASKGTRGKVPAARNFGLIEAKIQDGPHYSCRDRPNMTKKEAIAMVKGGLPDDKDKPFLSVIGQDADTRKVMEDVFGNPALAGVKEKVRLHSYKPDDPLVARYGFVTTGKPTIYLEDKDGKVLHRQDDYSGGAQALGTALAKAGLRKPDPLYPPDKDPDRRKPDMLPFLPASIPWQFYLVGAAGTAVFLAPGKKVMTR